MTNTDSAPRPSDPNPYVRTHPGHDAYHRGYTAATTAGIGALPPKDAITNREVHFALAMDTSDAHDVTSYRQASDMAAFWWGYADGAVIARKG